MSMKIRVRYTAELIVDAEAWDDKYDYHDYCYPGELWDHAEQIGEDAMDTFLSMNHVPGWARDAITVVSESTEVVDYGLCQPDSCTDCGAIGVLTGHMDCPYPQDHD